MAIVKRTERSVAPTVSGAGGGYAQGSPLGRVQASFAGDFAQIANAFKQQAIEERELMESAELGEAQVRFKKAMREKMAELDERDDYFSWDEEMTDFINVTQETIQSEMRMDRSVQSFKKWGAFAGENAMAEVQEKMHDRYGQAIMGKMIYSLTEMEKMGDKLGIADRINTMPDNILPDDKKAQMITEYHHRIDWYNAQNDAFNNYDTELDRERYPDLTDAEWDTILKQQRTEKRYQENEKKRQLSEYQQGNYFSHIYDLMAPDATAVSPNVIRGWVANGEVSEGQGVHLLSINKALMGEGGGGLKCSKIKNLETYQDLDYRLNLPVDHPDRAGPDDVAKALDEGLITKDDVKTLKAEIQDNVGTTTAWNTDVMAMGLKQVQAYCKEFISNEELGDEADPAAAKSLEIRFKQSIRRAKDEGKPLTMDAGIDLARKVISDHATATGIAIREPKGWFGILGEGNTEFGDFMQVLNELDTGLERQMASQQKLYSLEKEGSGGPEEPKGDTDDLTGEF
jgi:hypothetical protein